MKRRSPRKNDSGSVLLLVLVVLGLLSIGAGATWRYMHITLDQTKRHEHRVVAHHAAEAGLHTAAAHLRADPDYTGASQVQIGAGRFTIRVRPQEAQNTYELVAHGWAGDKRTSRYQQRLRAVLEFDDNRNVTRFTWQVYKP